MSDRPLAERREHVAIAARRILGTIEGNPTSAQLAATVIPQDDTVVVVARGACAAALLDYVTKDGITSTEIVPVPEQRNPGGRMN